MGVLRLLLAFSVVGAHCNSHPLLKFVGGEVAVQAFFVISGFYMAMIVESYETKKDFWISRYLRLYPVYIVCALMSLVLVHGVDGYIENIEKLPLSAILFLLFTNVTIFFQDITMFLGVSNDTLSFVKFFGDSKPPLFTFLLISQGWSLGVELLFYAIAPFLLKRSTITLVVVVIISELLRVLLIAYGYSGDPWSYRFFPTELSTFILGSLAYKSYKINKRYQNNKGTYSVIWLSFILLFLISSAYIPLEFQVKKIVFIVLLVFFVGNIFSVTKDSKVDNFIGVLSYPVYVCHVLVIGYFLPILKLSVPDGSMSTTIVTYVTILTFSVFLYLIIEKPVDSFRRRFKKK